MEQLAVGMAWGVVIGAALLWWATLHKLYPRYKAGTVRGGYRAAFQFVVVALSWVTMEIIVWLWLRVDALAALLSVLWAVGLLSWLMLGAVARTRRQVASETAAAQPQAQAPRGDAGPVRVRTQPRRHAAPLAAGPAAGRSALAQQALRRAVRP